MSEADRTPRARRDISARNSVRSGVYEPRSGYSQTQHQPRGYSHQAQPGATSGQRYDSQRGLRPMDSRFSLNEHFAATRREYEFGDDDASSFSGGRSSVIRGVEESVVEVGVQEAVILAPGDEGDTAGDDEMSDDEADFYEVLCVDREASKEEVRMVYYMWFKLLHSPSQEDDLARTYFLKVQEAFETLVDDRRREEYDVSLGRVYPSQKDGMEMNSDMGIRVDASGRKGVRPVDFVLGHSVSMGVTSLGTIVEEKIRRVQDFLARTKRDVGGDAQDQEKVVGVGTLVTPAPTITVSGYTYGLAEASSTAVPGQYHPLLYTLPRHKTELLRNLSPLATITLRQDLLEEGPPDEAPRASTLEIESSLLPTSFLTTRLSHTTAVHSSPASLAISLTGDRLQPGHPQLALAATRELESGVVFARTDSGHWRLRADETCRYFGEFSRLSGRLLSGGLGPRAASFEVGFTKGIPGKTVFRHEAMDILRGERAVSEPATAAWTVSVGGTAEALVSSLRYAMDIPRTKLEVELSATSRANHYVAIRSLFPLGTSLSALGLELSLSAQALHLSFSFSRLSQRFSLPIYMLPLPRTLLLAAAVPFFLSAGVSLLRRTKPTKSTKLRRKKSDMRREADSLTFLLHRALEQQPETGKSDLKILSAKYGAPEDGWAGENVADVTIALSALIRDGKVDIPAGLRTSHLPGFWDPAPKREKVLRARFRAGEREGVVEAKEGDGFTIP